MHSQLLALLEKFEIAIRLNKSSEDKEEHPETIILFPSFLDEAPVVEMVSFFCLIITLYACVITCEVRVSPDSFFRSKLPRNLRLLTVTFREEGNLNLTFEIDFETSGFVDNLKIDAQTVLGS